MKIIHLIDQNDPPLLARHQVLDRSLLSEQHEIETWTIRDDSVEHDGSTFPVQRISDRVRDVEPQLFHIYTSQLPPARTLRSLSVPWVAPTSPKRGWLQLGGIPEPDAIRSPHPGLGDYDPIPEAVDLEFFDVARPESDTPTVGGLVENEQSRSLFDAVRARIGRTRDDVVWRPFRERPTAQQMATIDVWADFGGGAPFGDDMIPEALVAGSVVVAARTELNRARLHEGDSGFLVPSNDPNEMAHVILVALFKPEIFLARAVTARSSRDRFRPQVRASILEELYASLT